MLPVLRNTSALAPAATSTFNRLDSLFDQFFGDDGGFSPESRSWAPLAMWEDEDHFFIEAELPGVTESDVDLTIHNGMLFIRGERKPEQGRRYLYNGRMFGRFERVVTLPESVNTQDVQATLTNGMLRITLARTPEAKPKKITIQTS